MSLFTAPMAKLFGLDTLADQIKFRVGKLHHMERIGDLGRVRKCDLIDPPVGARQVKRLSLIHI